MGSKKRKDFTAQATATLKQAEDIEISELPESSRQQITTSQRIRNARVININDIQPDPDQPRKRLNPKSLQELADSIHEHGVLQPITVEFQEGPGIYKIISGERRYHAARLAGLTQIPCIVHRDINKETRFALQLVENIQREDLSPIERARALVEYKELLGEQATWAEVEKAVGMSETRRKQFVALLDLPEHIQKEIVAIGRRPSQNQVTEKHARALRRLHNHPDKQQELFHQIRNSPSPISGDKAMHIANQMLGEDQIQKFTIKYRTTDDLIRALEAKLAELKQNYSLSPDG